MSEAEAPEKTKNEPEAPVEPTIEDRAQRMGWTPRDKFRGDPEKWVDAGEFVKRGEESLPILRERLRKADATIADLSKTAAEFKKMSDTAFDRAYTKAKRDLESEIEEKAKAGDGAGAKAAAKELAELETEKKEREVKNEADPVFDAWQAQNDWYKDHELQVEAEAIAFKLRKRGEKSEGTAFLDRVKDEMKKQFPEKFGNPRRQAASGVERSAGGGEGGGKKGWDQLPAEAKEAGARYIKQGFHKDKAAYAEAFWAQN